MKSLSLERFVPYRLNVAAAVVSNLIEERVLAAENISFPQWRIIAILGSDGPSAQQTFAKRTNMEKIMISRAVGALTKAGIVESQVSPEDRRARLLSLTKGGRELYRKISTKALEIERDIARLSGLPDTERLMDELERIELAVRTLRRSQEALQEGEGTKQ